jgi:hypothetical protein
MLSENKLRTSWLRRAPRATRRAVSRERTDARPAKSEATLAQAMKSRRPAPTFSGVLMRLMPSAVSGIEPAWESMAVSPVLLSIPRMNPLTETLPPIPSAIVTNSARNRPGDRTKLLIEYRRSLRTLKIHLKLQLKNRGITALFSCSSEKTFVISSFNSASFCPGCGHLPGPAALSVKGSFTSDKPTLCLMGGKRQPLEGYKRRPWRFERRYCPGSSHPGSNGQSCARNPPISPTLNPELHKNLHPSADRI